MSDSQQWYLAIGGHQVGPIGVQEVIGQIRNGSIQPNTYVFTPGMADWIPASKIEFFRGYFDGSSTPASIPKPPGRTAHEIDF